MARLWVWLAAALLAVGTSGTVDAGTFPAWPTTPPPKPIPGSPYVVAQWFSNPQLIENTFDVICEGVNIGQIHTQFGAGEFVFLQDDQQVRSFGDYIRFGFDRNGNNPCPPGTVPAPDVKYRWIQSVITNDPLTGQPNNEWFIDYATPPKGEPPFYSKDDQGRWGFTTATDDIPSRFRPAGDETTYWVAETALVCTYDKHINLIASFDWGFEVPRSGRMNWFAPSAFGPPSGIFEETLRADPYANDWSIGRDCCCVPEPSTWSMLLVGSACFSLTYVRTKRAGGRGKVFVPRSSAVATDA